MGGAKSGPEKAMQLRISVDGSFPEIWRLIEIDASTTLARFHGCIQMLFGWDHSHLHEVTIPARMVDGSKQTLVRPCSLRPMKNLRILSVPRDTRRKRMIGSLMKIANWRLPTTPKSNRTPMPCETPTSRNSIWRCDSTIFELTSPWRKGKAYAKIG